ncbi:MAG: HAD-IA family hydrolase [Acidobacteria bacterium]|nr:HAD-IA family hydrolase [Acidobacteriota bacterium]
MSRRYATLCLDAGGVLISPNWSRVAEVFGRYGVAVDADALRRAEPTVRRGLDTPRQISTSNDAQRGYLYITRTLELAGVDLAGVDARPFDELHAYHATANLWEHVEEDARLALAALHDRGVPMVVVSNANGRLHALLDRLGLSAYFDVVVDSAIEGVEKPDPRLFHLALARAGAAPESAVHVGDLYHVDVVGARQAGLDARLLDPHDLYPDADVVRLRSLTELIALFT